MVTKLALDARNEVDGEISTALEATLEAMWRKTFRVHKEMAMATETLVATRTQISLEAKSRA